MTVIDERAPMSTSKINDLPDSAFAYIEPGGHKDESGKTAPRSLRHFPIHDAAHVRNALARAPQSPFGKKAMPKILAAAKKFGIKVESQNSQEPSDLIRSAPFEIIRADSEGDGLTFEGYAAVFDTPTRINSWEGEFDEQIARGAFKDTLAKRTPVLMFEHGKHPLIGSMPLGTIRDAHEDDKGLFIRARLSDNWLIQPVRDAVRDGAVTGMSFRFEHPGKDDERWERRTDDVDLRTLLRIGVPELGPVVFPAYEPTTASVRSLAEQLPSDLVAEVPTDTGRSDARSTDGGESDAEPEDGEASTSTIPPRDTDGDSLRLRGILR